MYVLLPQVTYLHNRIHKLEQHQVRFRVLRLQSISYNTPSYGNNINVLFESCTEELDLSRNKFLRDNVLCDHVARAIRTDKVKLKTLRLDECDLTDQKFTLDTVVEDILLSTPSSRPIELTSRQDSVRQGRGES